MEKRQIIFELKGEAFDIGGKTHVKHLFNLQGNFNDIVIALVSEIKEDKQFGLLLYTALNKAQTTDVIVVNN